MSNKTLKAGARRTKSALKEIAYIFIFLALFFLIALSLWLVQGNKPNQDNSSQNTSSREYCAMLKEKADCQFKLEPLQSNEERLLGLSGRSGLENNKGMLFIFDHSSRQCMWMKDMRFSIDMIWLNKDKQITKVAENVSPDTYPESFCMDNTKYVIELPANQATTSGWTVGKQLKF